MKTTKNSEKINYAPPLLGNGSLSVMLDYCGRQGKVGAFDGKTCCVPEICATVTTQFPNVPSTRDLHSFRSVWSAKS